MENLPGGVSLNAHIDGFELLELEIQQAHIHKACTLTVQVGFCQDLFIETNVHNNGRVMEAYTANEAYCGIASDGILEEMKKRGSKRKKKEI